MSSSSAPSTPVDVNNLPYFAEGSVVTGFGRGSKELGIPTANFPEYVVRALPDSFACGVYYGWAKLGSSDVVYKMSFCVGWNPYYQNTVKTMETHILHTFPDDFYGELLKVIIVGFLRPMCDFNSLDALITAIHNDNKNASDRLDIPENLAYRHHPFFSAPPPSGMVANGSSSGSDLDSANQKIVNGGHVMPDLCCCDCRQSDKNCCCSSECGGAVDSKLCSGRLDCVDCECKVVVNGSSDAQVHCGPCVGEVCSTKAGPDESLVSLHKDQGSGISKL